MVITLLGWMDSGEDSDLSTDEIDPEITMFRTEVG